MSTSEENTALNDLLEKHKLEQKQLTSKKIAMRKSASKKTKREINSNIADLEYNLKTKQEEEIRALKLELNGVDPNDQENELDDGISLEQLDKLTIQDEDKSKNSDDAPKTKGKKVNKAKLRIEKRNAEMERLREEAEKEAVNMVDHGKLETNAIKELLVPMNLRIKQITADGHCLYNAFADQLKSKYNEEVTYKELRKSAAEYMLKNPDDFTPFLYLEDGNFEKYCNDIENTACWGGQLEILALARSRKVPVDIIQTDAPVLKICDDEYPEKPPIKLAYHKHLYSLGAHYNSLVELTTT